MASQAAEAVGCTLAEEAPDLPRATFDERYRRQSQPVVIRNATLHTSAAFRALTSIAALNTSYGDREVTLSSANAFSYGLRRETVAAYLTEMLGRGASTWARSVSDDQSASHLFYWFGEHGSELRPLLEAYPLPRYVYEDAGERDRGGHDSFLNVVVKDTT